MADKSGLLRTPFCEGSRLARDVSKTGPANCNTWCCHVQNLIVENAPPGVLSVYEGIDVKDYNKMFSNPFEPRHWVTCHQWDSISKRLRRSTCTLLACQLSKTDTFVTFSQDIGQDIIG